MIPKSPFGERERLGEQIADARLVVDDEHARACAAGGGPRRRRRSRTRTAAARTLAVEPGVDVALAEAPLPADADRGDLARFDQPVHRPEVDLEVLDDFLGGQKRFINHASTSS